ncbi:MAG TPA: hypothetical protein VMV18_08160, partial [bacterium]|nr:hypothetical protein [bacterium]
MRSARLLPCLLVAVALAGACALPSRDNIYDPDGAPTLKVAVLPDAAGCTPGSAPLSEWQAVSAASRGACIGLDARSAGANAAIRFFYVGPNGAQVELTPGNGIAFLATAGLAVIDDAPLRSLPAGAIARFRADIHRGGHHVVDATLALTNEAPVAIGDPPRHIPIGGYAWAPASAVDVTFSGALSVDPDHDPLRYRWVFSDGAVLVSAPGQSTVTRPVATSPARHLRALLIASDGLLASRPTAVDVEIGNPAVWSGGAIGSFSPIVHLDEIHATYPLPPLGPPKVYLRPAGVAHLEGGPIPLLVVLPINGFSVAQLNLFRFPYGEPLGSPLFGSGASGALRAAAGGTGVWLYEEDVPTLSRYDLDSGGTALVSPASVTDNLPAINGTNVSPLLEVDSTGAAWFSLVNSTALGHSAASGVSMLSTSAGHLVTAMAARPGSSELWELDNARLPTTAPAATLAAWDSTDDHVRRFALGPEFATALSWLDPSTLWIARVGDGVRVLDTDILETTGNVDLATLVHYPMSDHIDALVADPSTGDAWAHTTNLNLLRLGRFGEVSLYPEDTTPLFADDDGSIWFADATQAPGRGHTVTSDGALFRVPVSSLLSYANVDDEDGSVWVFSTDDRTLRHWATDGTLLGEIGTVAAPAGNPPAAIPPLDFLRFEPGGAALWAHA